MSALVSIASSITCLACPADLAALRLLLLLVSARRTAIANVIAILIHSCRRELLFLYYHLCLPTICRRLRRIHRPNQPTIYLALAVETPIPISLRPTRSDHIRRYGLEEQ
jgi:hypothetical protein